MPYYKQLQSIANEYMHSEKKSATSREITRWAIMRGKWKPPPSLLEQRLAEELSRAMRDEYITDPQGRSARNGKCPRTAS